VRGQSIRDVAARLAAEVSEHHGDGALVGAVLMAAYVQDEEGGGWMVPRRDLVSLALLLFEQEQLKIAEGLDLAGTLTAGFAGFKPSAPKEELEGWRLGRNDDLVLAVAMSVWAAERFIRKEDSVPVGALGAA
jgi:hypothetical protein